MDNEKHKKAMESFKKNMDNALKGKNVSEDIKKAVSQMLKDMGVEYQGK